MNAISQLVVLGRDFMIKKDFELIKKDLSLIKEELGLIHIYTGEGKGKTSAALGVAIRARGYNLNVLVAQLFKERTPEVDMLEKLGIKYIIYSSPHPFFKKYSSAEKIREAERCTTFVQDIFKLMSQERYDLVVIDEAGSALNSNFLDAKELERLIMEKPKNTELILTGIGFPDSIMKLVSDTKGYITEMKMKSHPYHPKGAEKNVLARKGIDY
jgi:cob(I)alamin adenosyltransferase